MQYHCGKAIAQWHAEVCGYQLTPETQIIHQDIASYKPDLSGVLDEISFRLFEKSEIETGECVQLQEELTKKENQLQMLINLILSVFGVKA